MKTFHQQICLFLSRRTASFCMSFSKVLGEFPHLMTWFQLLLPHFLPHTVFLLPHPFFFTCLGKLAASCLCLSFSVVLVEFRRLMTQLHLHSLLLHYFLPPTVLLLPHPHPHPPPPPPPPWVISPPPPPPPPVAPLS